MIPKRDPSLRLARAHYKQTLMDDYRTPSAVFTCWDRLIAEYHDREERLGLPYQYIH